MEEDIRAQGRRQMATNRQEGEGVWEEWLTAVQGTRSGRLGWTGARRRRRVGDGRLKKMAMAAVTRLPGLRWSPERTNPSTAILQDVPPSDDNDGGCCNKGKAVVTAAILTLISSRRRRGQRGKEGGMDALDLGFSFGTVIGRAGGRGGHPWPGCCGCSTQRHSVSL